LGPLLLAVVLLNGCWYQSGWGPGRTGHNPEEDHLTIANVATLAQAWSTDLGTGPVLDPVSSRSGVHVVSGRTVTTVNRIDGSVLWDYTPDLGPQDRVASPSIGAGSEGDRVYVPMSIYNGEGTTHILEGTTGRLVQTTRYGDTGSIAMENDYTAAVDNAEGDYGTLTILAYGSYGYSSWSTVVASADDDAPPATPAALGENRIVLGLGHQVLVYPRSCSIECTTEWRTDLDGTATRPALSTETVYVGDSSGGVSALSLVDGSVRWEADLGGGDRGVLAPLTLGNGQLYVTSSDGRLYAFDADGCGSPTCTPAWEAAVGAPVDKQAALAGGVLYVGTQDGTLHAFDATGCGAAACDPVWSTDTGSRITGAPAVSNGHLLVGTEDGRLLAYRPS
jgi:outer membrane protein assembly factor BamB